MIYTVGAQTDRRLGIPGEDLPGSWPATAFVAWYNGHPDFQDLDFDLSHERAVVVGNGNVAIDCARMLALTAQELASTDTVAAAEQAIIHSGIREIVMLGRRGPVQAAFTPPELQELGELAGADVVVDPRDLELDAASAEALEADRERARRNVDLLREFAAREPKGLPRRIVLRLPRLARSRSSATSASRRSSSCATSSSPKAGGSSRGRPGSARPCPAGSSSAASATRESSFPESRSTAPARCSRTRTVASSAPRGRTSRAGSSEGRAA